MIHIIHSKSYAYDFFMGIDSDKHEIVFEERILSNNPNEFLKEYLESKNITEYKLFEMEIDPDKILKGDESQESEFNTKLLIDILEKYSYGPVSLSDEIESLCFDSIDYLSVSLDIEEKFDVVLTDIPDVKTVGEFENFVKNKFFEKNQEKLL